MAAAAAAYALRGVRWKALLDPLDPSTRLIPCINGINISNVGNLVIPYFGELLRCGVITRHSRRDPETGRPVATFDRVLGTAILERCWDILTVVLLLFVLLFARSGSFAYFLGEKIFQPMAASLQGWKLWLTLSILVLLAAAIFLVVRLRNRYPFCRRISFISSIISASRRVNLNSTRREEALSSMGRPLASSIRLPSGLV